MPMSVEFDFDDGYNTISAINHALYMTNDIKMGSWNGRAQGLGSNYQLLKDDDLRHLSAKDQAELVRQFKETYKGLMRPNNTWQDVIDGVNNLYAGENEKGNADKKLTPEEYAKQLGLYLFEESERRTKNEAKKLAELHTHDGTWAAMNHALSSGGYRSDILGKDAQDVYINKDTQDLNADEIHKIQSAFRKRFSSIRADAGGEENLLKAINALKDDGKMDPKAYLAALEQQAKTGKVDPKDPAIYSPEQLDTIINALALAGNTAYANKHHTDFTAPEQQRAILTDFGAQFKDQIGQAGGSDKFVNILQQHNTEISGGDFIKKLGDHITQYVADAKKFAGDHLSLGGGGDTPKGLPVTDDNKKLQVVLVALGKTQNYDRFGIDGKKGGLTTQDADGTGLVNADGTLNIAKINEEYTKRFKDLPIEQAIGIVPTLKSGGNAPEVAGGARTLPAGKYTDQQVEITLLQQANEGLSNLKELKTDADKEKFERLKNTVAFVNAAVAGTLTPEQKNAFEAYKDGGLAREFQYDAALKAPASTPAVAKVGKTDQQQLPH